jgi:DNA ligase-1
MKAFTDLYFAIDETTKTNAKVNALADYFRHAPPADAAWAAFFLMGRRIRQSVSTPKLRLWAAMEAGVPDWMFDECWDAVGDLAETMALLMPHEGSSAEQPLSWWVQERLIPLREKDEDSQHWDLVDAWRSMDARERFIWNKLITGSFRVGASHGLVVRGLAKASGLEADVIAHRLMGDWTPGEEFYGWLVSTDTNDTVQSKPYPFALAYAINESGNEVDPATLGDVHEWIAEWKWDGIRAQLIRRKGCTYIWSRGEDLITERFPEIEWVGSLLPDGTVIDGEILGWKSDRPLPFADLQKRIGRKTLGKKILADVPVSLIAFDLLEWQGEDVRSRPLEWRRATLAALIEKTPADGRLRLSRAVSAEGWEDVARERDQARELGAEGLMLKRLSSPYSVGRVRGDWWKWKVNPYSVDAVLIYAQRGHGRRASLYTDYTFGVWDGDKLVPFAKAYSGLTDEEIRRVDSFVRRNTLEKFGPVRTVKPELVFELAFEGLQKSTRHKSGIAVRFPRMAKWRTDKKVEDADSLETIRAMLEGHLR